MSRTRPLRRAPDWQQSAAGDPAGQPDHDQSQPRFSLRYLLRILIAILLCIPLLLAGCSDDASDAESDEVAPLNKDDPAITAALGGKLMIDPDLVSQNEGSSALTAASWGALPMTNMTPQAAEAARSDAARKIGGAALNDPPEAIEADDSGFELASLTAETRAKALPGAERCADRLRYSSAWAARMPKDLPVYPHGAALEAAGTDGSGCALRVVRFMTPVGVDDVVSFYNAKASKAGYSVKYASNSAENILTGTKGKASFGVYIRTIREGATSVDLVTNGGAK